MNGRLTRSYTRSGMLGAHGLADQVLFAEVVGEKGETKGVQVPKRWWSRKGRRTLTPCAMSSRSAAMW